MLRRFRQEWDVVDERERRNGLHKEILICTIRARELEQDGGLEAAAELMQRSKGLIRTYNRRYAPWWKRPYLRVMVYTKFGCGKSLVSPVWDTRHERHCRFSRIRIRMHLL